MKHRKVMLEGTWEGEKKGWLDVGSGGRVGEDVGDNVGGREALKVE